MLTSTLLLGLVIGMQHAFEADYLAAMSTIVGRKSGWREITLRSRVASSSIMVAGTAQQEH